MAEFNKLFLIVIYSAKIFCTRYHSTHVSIFCYACQKYNSLITVNADTTAVIDIFKCYLDLL